MNYSNLKTVENFAKVNSLSVQEVEKLIKNYELKAVKIDGVTFIITEFAAGDFVEITKCLSDHEFEIGQTVFVVKKDDEFCEETWLCRDKNGKEFYITQEEATIVQKD